MEAHFLLAKGSRGTGVMRDITMDGCGTILAATRLAKGPALAPRSQACNARVSPMPCVWLQHELCSDMPGVKHVL